MLRVCPRSPPPFAADALRQRQGSPVEAHRTGTLHANAAASDEQERTKGSHNTITLIYILYNGIAFDFAFCLHTHTLPRSQFFRTIHATLCSHMQDSHAVDCSEAGCSRVHGNVMHGTAAGIMMMVLLLLPDSRLAMRL